MDRGLSSTRNNGQMLQHAVVVPMNHFPVLSNAPLYQVSCRLLGVLCVQTFEMTYALCAVPTGFTTPGLQFGHFSMLVLFCSPAL